MEGTRQIDPNATGGCCAPAGKSGWLSTRNVVIGAIVLGSAAGLFFGWNWLVAAGLASIIAGILPCLAMCALGLCMNRMGKKDAPASGASVPPKEAPLAEKKSAG